MAAALVLFLISLRFARLSLHPIEESIRRLTEYNRHLSHEVRTPLAIIRSNLQLAKAKGDFESAVRYIDSSVEEVSTMESIVQGLLFLSEKKELTEKEWVNLRDTSLLLYRGLNQVPAYQKKNIGFAFEGDAKYNVEGNADLIRSLLQNILENACKYADADSTVILRTNKTGWEVENRGRTLSREELTHLFDPFYKGKGDYSGGF